MKRTQKIVIGVVGLAAVGGLVYYFWPSAIDRAKQAALEYHAVVRKWTVEHPPTTPAEISAAQVEIGAARQKYIDAGQAAGVTVNA